MRKNKSSEKRIARALKLGDLTHMDKINNRAIHELNNKIKDKFIFVRTIRG